MKKIIVAGMWAGLLSGCHTMGYLENVGEGYSNGDYISSSFMLALTPLMLVPDVFTLGGLLDDQQTSDLWLGAATQYAAHEENNRVLQQQHAALQQQYAQQKTVAEDGSSRRPAWSEQSQRALDRQPQADEAVSATVQSSLPTVASSEVPTVSAGNSTKAASYSGLSNHCLKGSRNADGSIALRNTCNTPIAVRFCYTRAARSFQQQYICKPISTPWAREGVTYSTQDPGAVAPGSTMNVASGGGSIAYVGCASPYIFPIISSVSASQVRGYCVRP